MQNNINLPFSTEEYAADVAKIRKKKRLIIIFFSIAAAVVVLLGSEYYTPNGYVQPLGTLPTALLLIGLLLGSFILTAIAVAPLGNSLMTECDPKKHIALNVSLNQKHFTALDTAPALLLMGEFEAAENLFNRFTGGAVVHQKFTALFGKARCQFFLGKTEHLDACHAQLTKLLESEKLGARRKIILARQNDTMALMCALAHGDKEEIAEALKKQTPWDEFKPAETYFHYFSGIAAEALGDKENTIYHLAWVKNNANKTVLATLSAQSLEKIEMK